MDLSKLRAFVVVAEELNFRRSAEVLGMSQPPLSRLIAGLEEDLSTPLFIRNTRQVSLTGAGVHLLREAKQLIAQSERIESEIRSIAKLQSGKLSIGFSATTFLAKLPLLLDDFRNRFPKLKLEISQESKTRIYSGLRVGVFDVGFVEGCTQPEGFASHLVRDERFGVLLPRHHRLSERSEVQLKDLKDETIIVHPRKDSEHFFDTINQLFRRAGVKPTMYVKNEREVCPILVALGKGIVLTISNTQNFVSDETCFVPFKQVYLPMHALWSENNSNPSLKCFLSFVMESQALRKPGLQCVLDVVQK
ncbi:MAG: LysR family transcriptional regulator [Luteolibacter sp.]